MVFGLDHSGSQIYIRGIEHYRACRKTKEETEKNTHNSTATCKENGEG